MQGRTFSLTGFETRAHKVAARHVFAIRMLRAVGLWLALTGFGLVIGIAGYAHFEGGDIYGDYLKCRPKEHADIRL